MYLHWMQILSQINWNDDFFSNLKAYSQIRLSKHKAQLFAGLCLPNISKLINLFALNWAGTALHPPCALVSAQMGLIVLWYSVCAEELGWATWWGRGRAVATMAQRLGSVTVSMSKRRDSSWICRIYIQMSSSHLFNKDLNQSIMDFKEKGYLINLKDHCVYHILCILSLYCILSPMIQTIFFFFFPPEITESMPR